MEKIENLIEKKGLKKKHIAKQLGMRPETFSRKLSNPETFTATQMADISKILEKEIEDIDFNVNFF